MKPPVTNINLRARPGQYFAYSGRSILVTGTDGQVRGDGIQGFYAEATRLLSRFEITADGQAIKPAGLGPVSGAALLGYFEVPGMEGVPEHSVYLQLACFVNEGMRVTLRLGNYSRERKVARFELAIRLAADFGDLEEANQGKRTQQAEVESEWNESNQELLFRYCHPQLNRAVTIRLEGAPTQAQLRKDGDEHLLVVALELIPHEPTELQVVVEPHIDGQHLPAPPGIFGEASSRLGSVRRQLQAEVPRLITSNTTVARAWQTATTDLASLPLGLDPGPAAPIAGLPMYQQLFGRDTLTIAWQALMAFTTMMRDTLRLNAAWQGAEVNDWYDEEPGKLIHQARRGPLSVLGLDPFLRYYGDYATPPDFLIMLGQYLSWTDDRETVRRLLPAARKAIEWCDRYGDLDGDGFLEYVTRSPKGVKNQGWKDSYDAIVDEQGNIIDTPIATCEIQAYWFVGLQQAAIAFAACGHPLYAVRLLRKAARLKRRFNRAFWMEDLGFYAMALGPDKRQVRSIASNAGHLLGAGIVPVERAPRVARRLMQADMFSGWGVRTLSSAHSAYNPFSYHLGSVWPVENGTFALGFARYGCWRELHRLAEGMFASTELFAGNRLPEVLGGIERDEKHPHPGIYPDSNQPQGWSDSAIVMLVQSLLGMHAIAPLHLLIVDPHLPPWLPDLELKGIRVGKGRVDLKVWRTRDGKTRYRVTRREGPVQVLRQPPPQMPGVSPVSRVVALPSLVAAWLTGRQRGHR